MMAIILAIVTAFLPLVRSGPVLPPPSALAVPQQVFRPASVAVRRVATNSDYTVIHDAFPRALHSHGYATWHRISGYYEEAGIPSIVKGAVAEFFEYEGSVFENTKGAAAAWRDGSQHPVSENWTRISCPGMGSVSCTRLRFQGVDSHDRTSWVDVLRVNQCLLETAGAANLTYMKNRPHEVLDVLYNLDRAAVARAKVVCK